MKFIIRVNTGYGDEYQEVDCNDENEAEKEAFEVWREQVENNADYGVLEYTEENVNDYL